jgi:hypothetical protein
LSKRRLAAEKFQRGGGGRTYGGKYNYKEGKNYNKKIKIFVERQSGCLKRGGIAVEKR